MPIFTKAQEIEMAYAQRNIQRMVVKEDAWQKFEAFQRKKKEQKSTVKR